MKKAPVGGFSANHIATSWQKGKMNSQTGEIEFEDCSWEPRNLQRINFAHRVGGHSPKLPHDVEDVNEDAQVELNRNKTI